MPELPRMTEAEYLAFEETAELRHGFHAGRVSEREPGTYDEALIGGNLGGGRSGTPSAGRPPACSAAPCGF